jgi:trimeric autotransporter adhesin
MAIGVNASAAGTNSVALGTSANAGADGSVAIGQQATATGGQAVAVGIGNTASGNGAVAIGDPDVATGTGAVALGGTNTATGQGAVAIGNANSAMGTGSVAIGNASNAAGAGSLAFGSNAVANNPNDVALGSGSMTAAPNPTASATIGGVVYPFAGAAPTSVVSVGAPGAERQITNVAAGQISATSTDAVNGSQLNATNQAVNSLSATTSTGMSSLSTGLASTNNSVASLSTGLSTTNSTIATLSTGETSMATTLNQLSTTINSNPAISGTKSGIAADMNNTGAAPPTVTSGSNSVAVGANSNDGGRSNVVSVGNDTQQRQIVNVAPGTQGTDAVNVNQLNIVAASASQTMQNQQVQINTLDSALQQTDQMARQGIAAATALTMVPQVEPGKTVNVGVGVARFAGQSGMALAASAHVTTNGIVKLGIGVAGSNKTYGAGYGYSW